MHPDTQFELSIFRHESILCPTSLANQDDRDPGYQLFSGPGTGAPCLGFTMACRIIEGHHGQTWLESQDEGQGAQTYIDLPLAVDSA
jgi:hypothetical protein